MNQDLKKISELDFIKKLQDKKKIIDSHRPLSSDLENRIFQKLKLDWNYNSNAIEGNTFTYGETVALLMEGITAKGKPLKDALDIKGHNDAIQFMLDMIKGERELNEADIRSLHKLILGTEYENPSLNKEGKIVGKKVVAGQYKTMPNHVLTSTGETHYYATPEETPAKMTELVSWFNKNANLEEVNPVVLASVFHHRFVAIHPFDDGNGRMTRILTNFILMKFGYPISVVKNEKKKNYYATLAQADSGEILPFVELMSETINNSLDIYIKGINGEDINDPDDLDKEIELFRKEIGIRNAYISVDNIDKSLFIFNIIRHITPKLRKITDIFYDAEEFLKINESGYLTISDWDFNDYERFKSIFFLKKIDKKIIYNFGFFNDVFDKNNIELNYRVKIIFNKFNYKIFSNNKSVLKYYDDSNIIDNDVKELLDSSFREFLKEIKIKIKK